MEMVDWVPSVIALVAVIVGPIVALRVAKRQIRATTVSSNRQEWINNLRQEIAGFLTDLYKLGTLGAPNELAETHRSLQLHRSMIVLMIHPDEDKHRRLVRLLDDALELVALEGETGSGPAVLRPLPSDDSSVARYQREIQSLSQKILKEEWERVKTGD